MSSFWVSMNSLWETEGEEVFLCRYAPCLMEKCIWRVLGPSVLLRVQQKHRSASRPSVEAGGSDLWWVENIHFEMDSMPRFSYLRSLVPVVVPTKGCTYLYLTASFA